MDHDSKQLEVSRSLAVLKSEITSEITSIVRSDVPVHYTALLLHSPSYCRECMYVCMYDCMYVCMGSSGHIIVA